jgi:hypothetical protein
MTVILPIKIINYILSYRPTHPIAKIIKGPYHPAAKVLEEYINMYNCTELKQRKDVEDIYRRSFYDYWSQRKHMYRMLPCYSSEIKYNFIIPPSFDCSYIAILQYTKCQKVTLKEYYKNYWIDFENFCRN